MRLLNKMKGNKNNIARTKNKIKTIEYNPEHKNKLIKSINKLLGINNVQTYYPFLNKFTNLKNNNKNLTKYIFDSKYKCIEILNIDCDEYNNSPPNDDEEIIYDKNSFISDNINKNKINGVKEVKEFDIKFVKDIRKDVNNDSKIMLSEDIDKDYNDDDKDISLCLPIGCVLNKNNGNKYNEKGFIKISPILDPVQVLKRKMNEYNMMSADIFLPNVHVLKTVNKVNSYNNSCYIETSLIYLLSNLVENGLCPSFPYYYGAMNGVKELFYFDITEEYESYKGSKWFMKGKGKLFELVIKTKEYENDINDWEINTNDDNNENKKTYDEVMKLFDSCKDDENKSDSEDIIEIGKDVIECTSTSNDSDYTDIDESNSDSDNEELLNSINGDLDDLINKKNNNSFKNNKFSNSDCDYNSDDDEYIIDDYEDSDSDDEPNNLNGKDKKEFNDNNLDIEDIDEIGSSIDINELAPVKTYYYMKFYNYPVQINIMENVGITLDNLLDEGYEMSDLEWLGMYFQVAFGLATAYKHYEFCHGDLHSSNVVFKSTKLKYLYFNISDKYGKRKTYRIPTFGKIAKIIDFGRGTYKLNGKWMFSDVFARDGDAEGQYTFPYKNETKMRHKPNPSFDLARFTITILERLDIEEHPLTNKLAYKLMEMDNGDNASELDDDFSMYIDISRYCSNAVPYDVLNMKCFNRFRIPDKPKKDYVYYL